MKKEIILRCVLTLMLLVGIYGGGSLTVLAAGQVTVQVNDVNVSPGETVTTELVMNGTFATFQGRLLYDTDALILEKMEAADAISGGMTIFNQDAVTGEFVDASFASASTSDMEINGTVLTLTFRAGDEASGSYSFRVEQFQVYDAAGEELTVEAVDTVVDRETLEPMGTFESGDTEPEDSGISTAEVKKAEQENKQSKKSKPSGSQAVPKPLTSSWNGSVQSDNNGGIILFAILAIVVVAGIAIAVFLRSKKKRDK